MTIETAGEDAEAAALLVGYGFRAKLLPSRDDDYAMLVRRYEEDPDFGFLVKRVAAGLGLRVLGVSMRSGIVHTALPNSVFETRMDQFVRQARVREPRTAERVLHGIAHLAVAALCFPRAEDLVDDGRTGRVWVSEVDRYVRSVCDTLAERAAEAEEDDDPPADAPELERAWHAYRNRPEVAPTKKRRAGYAATRTVVTNTLTYLCDYGMLKSMGVDPERREQMYRSTHRYQLHVRELAATRAYQELLDLKVPLSAERGGLSVTDETTLYDD